MEKTNLIALLILTSYFGINAQEECNNAFVKETNILLPHPDIIPNIGTYCNFLKYGSCCSEQYLKTDMNKRYQEFKTSLYANYSLTVNHYGDFITRAASFNSSQFEKLYTYALKFTQTNDNTLNSQLFHKIDTQQDFLKTAKRIYNQLTQGFDTCSETLLAHLAGQMCLYCDPSFIQGFRYNKYGHIEVDFDYNVCYQFQRKCYKYIEARILIAGVKNLVLMLDKLYRIQDIIYNYETFPGFKNKQKFALELKTVEHDDITIPPLCYSEFQCPWACSNLVGPSGLDFDLILNPTTINNYSHTDTKLQPLPTQNTTNLRIIQEDQEIILEAQNDMFVWTTQATNSINFGKKFSGLDWRKQNVILDEPKFRTSGYQMLQKVSFLAVWLALILLY